MLSLLPVESFHSIAVPKEKRLHHKGGVEMK